MIYCALRNDDEKIVEELAEAPPYSKLHLESVATSAHFTGAKQNPVSTFFRITAEIPVHIWKTSVVYYVFYRAWRYGDIQARIWKLRPWFILVIKEGKGTNMTRISSLIDPKTLLLEIPETQRKRTANCAQRSPGAYRVILIRNLLSLRRSESVYLQISSTIGSVQIVNNSSIILLSITLRTPSRRTHIWQCSSMSDRKHPCSKSREEFWLLGMPIFIHMAARA